ncbi:unnamed protein product [Acanthoscelides obtectus]|uniref:Reverse transcriptase domain-containing protein n=1 Tax=Acanthoscelides obtectus TaxID=200917 RepID=A0A9P0P1Z7_ACAOB|nr:unnamed protein product [Acanthoscelides obtectus]CAK1651701.1 RNA-directed DNA polymerase from mobile element jockey [Acanthoscelides obtectus]
MPIPLFYKTVHPGDESYFFPRVSHASSLLDLFLTTHPAPYSTAVLSPLGNSDHGVVEVRFRSEPAVAAETRTGRKTWHYGHADWEGLRDFFSSFPWKDVCFTDADASAVCSSIREIIHVGMEEYIPHTVKVPRPGSNGWFNKSTFLQNPTVENRQADAAKAEVLAKTFAANSTMDVPPNVQVSSIQRVPYTMREVTFRHKTVRRRCAPELAPSLSRLFQISYESGTFPENWKFAHGSKTDPYNYRPIALALHKVMERCINRELLDYLERHGLISDKQYGFRHQRSTGDLLAYVTQLWSKLIQSYGEAHVVALDITKAFDQLWHAALLSKLSSYGLPEKLCRWVADFISGREISVVIDGFSSSSHNVNAGVPQGSVLAPTLFLLHINDLLSCTINPIHIFADDSTLEKRRLAMTSSLTRDLEATTAWGRNNLVQFNASKTQHCTLTNKKLLPKSHSFRLVGVQITEDLIWHEHISSIVEAAGKKLGYLFRAKKYFSPHDLLTLYKAQIRPILEYCSHRRAVRLIDDSSLTLSSMMPSRNVPE